MPLVGAMYFFPSSPILKVCGPRMYVIVSASWYTFCVYDCGAFCSGPRFKLERSSIITFGKFSNPDGAVNCGPCDREYDPRRLLMTRLEIVHTSEMMAFRPSTPTVPRNCGAGSDGLKSGERKRSYRNRVLTVCLPRFKSELTMKSC